VGKQGCITGGMLVHWTNRMARLYILLQLSLLLPVNALQVLRYHTHLREIAFITSSTRMTGADSTITVHLQWQQRHKVAV
jgi:hypothetical protein